MKKRNLSNRKKTALRRILALVLVLAATSALGLYAFLPVQAVREVADVEDVEHPRTVRWFYDGALPATRFAVYSLTDGDHALLLSVTGWNLLMGWYGKTYAAIETWEEAALYAGVYIYRQEDRTAAYIYGKLKDDRISSLTAELRFYDYEPEEKTESVPLAIAEDAIFEKDGTRYFISRTEVDERIFEDPFDICVTGWEAAGGSVQTVEANTRSWSS